MARKSKRKKRSIAYKYSTISIIPILLIVFAVPLIVRLKALEISPIVQQLNSWEPVIADFFSYYKTRVFILLTGIGIVLFLYKYLVTKDIPFKKTNLYYPMAAYGLLVLLSTLLAPYGDVAVGGYPERYEGVYMLLGYMAILFITINLVNEDRQYQYILLGLGVSAIIMSMLGITQLVGKDFFATDIGLKILLPKEYLDMAESMKFRFGASKTVYATLYNINYVGVYMSMVFTLSTTILLLTKDIKIRLILALVSILTFINLMGSASKAGILSIGLYIVLLLVFFRFQILRRWKATVLAIFLFTALAYGFNHYREGFLTKRFEMLKNTITATEEESNLHDIILGNNMATIQVEDYEIKVIFGSSGFDFLDKDFQFLNTKYNDEKGIYSFSEEPYKGNTFQLANYENGIALISRIQTNKGRATFNLVLNDEGHFRIMTPSGETIREGKAPSWGFKGRERFASGRGYIWSRSLPLLKDTVLIGHGPDTYALYFPQDDYLDKLQHRMSVNTLVDKPHNMYIQAGINTGVLSLISLLILFLLYIVTSTRIYIMKKEYENFIEVAGISIFFSIFIYLFTGLSNDSIVSVAPVFWVLLGLGISINMKLMEEKYE